MFFYLKTGNTCAILKAKNHKQAAILFCKKNFHNNISEYIIVDTKEIMDQYAIVFNSDFLLQEIEENNKNYEMKLIY